VSQRQKFYGVLSSFSIKQPSVIYFQICHKP
jgi:hypothetical protein